MVSWFYSRNLKNMPFLFVFVIEMCSVAYAGINPQHWLRAVGGMTLGMAVAGWSRLLLSNEQAGLLRVRQRYFDVCCYWTLGVGAITFGLALPQR